ncbi:MAG: metallophosphoesterase [Deltaproteobacteria bacterium]|nr:metallophosphoesterase [Deltaproteobacteria bacterium]
MPRWLAALFFLSTALVVWGGLNLYVYFRVANGFDLGSKARLALKIGFVVLALAYLAGRLLESFVGDKIAAPLLWSGAVWMGVFSITLSMLVIFDVWVTLPVWVLKRSAVLTPAHGTAIARWGLAAVLALSAGLSAWGARTALAGPKLTDLKLPVAGLPASLEGFTIIAASDIHIGDVVTHGYLDRMVHQIDDLHPDLVVLVGDLSDERNGGDGTAFRRMAGIRARHGVIGVTGNHEYYSGAEKQVGAIEAAGIPVLRQSHRVVADALVVAGIDDPAFLGGRAQAAASMDEALKGRPQGLPVVLLAHQPIAVHHAAELGVSLMLCGHTHGGQLPPFQLLSGLAYPFLKGLYEVGAMRVYVSNGAGFWGPPIRVFADPEIVRVTLTAAAPPR